MSHSTETPNIDLPQFADNDKPTWRGDVNVAMQRIDTHAGLVDNELAAIPGTYETKQHANDTFETKAHATETFVSMEKPTGADDSAALNAALSSGRKVIDGGGRAFTIASSITVPPDVTFQNAKVTALTAGMNMVLMSDRSKALNVHLIGTGSIGEAGTDLFERGIYCATDGASDVELDVTVENLTVAVNPRPLDVDVPKRWYGTIRVNNIVGRTGNSEGYGLLASPAAHCNLKVIAREVKRHAIYLSNGATDNYIELNSTGGDHSPVQLYSTEAQPATRNNRVVAVLDDVNSGIGADATWGATLFGKTENNYLDISIRDSTCEGAVLLRSAHANAICQRNVVVVQAMGSSFTGDIIRGDASVENVVELYGKGTTSHAGRALIGVRPYLGIVVPATSRHCIHVKRLNWDADGTDLVPILSSVTALRTDIGKGVIDLYNSTHANNLSDFTAGKIDGWISEEALTVISGAVAAGAEATVTFNFSRTYPTTRVFSLGASMVGVTGAANAPDITLTAITSTTATVVVKNNTGAQNAITVRMNIKGW